ncbi:MAG: PQQ-dependent dehydrogenase, methanol/ethanol family [Longimicrobiales bacterium]
MSVVALTSRPRAPLPVLLIVIATSCGIPSDVVDDAALRAADADSANWLTYGRTYDEQRHSPLRQIDEANVSRLGLAWSLDLNTLRGLEGTPLVHNGVLYTTSAWSVLHAVNAATGQMLWTYDPQVPKQHAKFACCDVVNRGPALYEGRVYVGALDGRLVAVDAATGQLAWEVQTTPKGTAYTITGAPRVAGGRVLIGNGGAEYGVRGYVTAYAAATGEQLWRTYTVPGDPSRPFESEALRRAATTWSGEYWKAGGGGTAWDAIVYDPELDYVYIGVGNGSPWYRRLRSKDSGDNLYLASILAVRADNGEYVWHYQTTPGDNWDYTATQPLMLATLTIDGAERRVIMQAPKNGFFYVLDRADGKLISAQPYAKMNWATGIDSAGRPIEAPAARALTVATTVTPSTYGAHNWHPMSYNPATGLVYFPVSEGSFLHVVNDAWTYDSLLWNVGDRLARYTGPALQKWLAEPVEGRLSAWDPVAQREVWRAAQPFPFSGGTLSTAGNLVVQGRADGKLLAHRATDGNVLWEFDTGVGIMAPPITYLVDGRQYVAVLSGWGGPGALWNDQFGKGAWGPGRLLAFALDGSATLPAAKAAAPPVPPPTFTLTARAADIAEGAVLYEYYCSFCHGTGVVSGSGVPDLRYATRTTHEQFEPIVRGGLRAPLGMPSFGDNLTAAQVRMVQAHVLQRARESARN